MTDGEYFLSEVLRKWGGRDDRERDKHIRAGFEAGQEFERKKWAGIEDPEALMVALEKMRQGHHEGDNEVEHDAVIEILDKGHANRHDNQQ